MPKTRLGVGKLKDRSKGSVGRYMDRPRFGSGSFGMSTRRSRRDEDSDAGMVDYSSGTGRTRSTGATGGLMGGMGSLMGGMGGLSSLGGSLLGFGGSFLGNTPVGRTVKKAGGVVSSAGSMVRRTGLGTGVATGTFGAGLRGFFGMTPGPGSMYGRSPYGGGMYGASPYGSMYARSPYGGGMYGASPYGGMYGRPMYAMGGAYGMAPMYGGSPYYGGMYGYGASYPMYGVMYAASPVRPVAAGAFPPQSVNMQPKPADVAEKQTNEETGDTETSESTETAETTETTEATETAETTETTEEAETTETTEEAETTETTEEVQERVEEETERTLQAQKTQELQSTQQQENQEKQAVNETGNGAGGGGPEQTSDPAQTIATLPQKGSILRGFETEVTETPDRTPVFETHSLAKGRGIRTSFIGLKYSRIEDSTGLPERKYIRVGFGSASTSSRGTGALKDEKNSGSDTSTSDPISMDRFNNVIGAIERTQGNIEYFAGKSFLGKMFSSGKEDGKGFSGKYNALSNNSNDFVAAMAKAAGVSEPTIIESPYMEESNVEPQTPDEKEIKENKQIFDTGTMLTSSKQLVGGFMLRDLGLPDLIRKHENTYHESNEVRLANMRRLEGVLAGKGARMTEIIKSHMEARSDYSATQITRYITLVLLFGMGMQRLGLTKARTWSLDPREAGYVGNLREIQSSYTTKVENGVKVVDPEKVALYEEASAIEEQIKTVVLNLKGSGGRQQKAV